MARVTEITDMRADVLEQKVLDASQLMNLMLFGGSLKETPKAYDPNHVYAKTDKILVVKNDGSMKVLSAKHSNTTGEFDPNKWETFNLFAGSGVGGGGSTAIKTSTSNNNSVVFNLLSI